MKYIFFISALTCIVAVVVICAFIFVNAVPAIKEIGILDFLLGENWKPGNDIYGIFPMILGSIYVTAGAIILGVPIGILTSVYLSYYCSKKLYKFLKPAVELLAGIPSVVYGFFGMVILIPIIRSIFGEGGNSMLTASLLLGIMILPTIVGVCESAIKAVHSSVYEGALALGASRERSIFFTVLPAAKSGIFASVVLGTGRAIGETMAVVMVAGNQPRIPTGILKGVRTMTANIVLEMGYAADLHREALIATAAVLFVFILAINIAFSIIKRRHK